VTDPRQRESRLGAEAASSENQPGGRSVVSSLPEPTHAGTDDTAADHNLPTVEYLEGYEEGLIHGDVTGYQRAHDEWHARAEVSAAVARQIANTPSYAELAIRRGQPARAAAQVATLIRNGVTP